MARPWRIEYAGALYHVYRGVDDRNLLVLSAWQTGVLSNKEIGELFGITHSSVSHIVKPVRKKLPRDRDLKQRFITVNSLFKM